MTPHWATDLIGLPYTNGADGRSTEGPDTFNCWGLVRWVFKNKLGVEMPVVGIAADEDQELAIRNAAAVSGWRRVADVQPKDNDILLMWQQKERHVGVALVFDGMVFVLHAVEETGVTVTPYNEMWFMGYKDITCWRKT